MMKLTYNKSGFIFVAVMGFMIIMLMTSAAYFFTRKLDFQVALNREDALQAFYLAESGMVHMLDYAYQKPDVILGVKEGQPFNLPSPVYYNGLGGQYKAYLEKVPDEAGRVDRYRAVGEATVGKITKKAAMYFDLLYPFGHAIMVGGRLNVSKNYFKDSSGTDIRIFGDVLYRSFYGDAGKLRIQNGGLIKLSFPPLPVPVFEKYASLPGVIVNETITFNFAKGQVYNGIYYIKGTKYSAPPRIKIEEGAVINGTIITTGDVFVYSRVHVNPDQSQGYPAIVAGGQVNIMGDNTHFNGLVYGGTNAGISGNNVNFNGGLIVGWNLWIAEGGRVQIKNNSPFRPPFFKYSRFNDQPFNIILSQWTDEVN